MSRAKAYNGVDGKRVGFVVFCPACRCGHTFQTEHPCGPNWTFNGDVEKPTFCPSIKVNSENTGQELPEFHKDCWAGGPGKWRLVCHSFVTDGRIKFLDDCTHALAGQTVDLPEFET